MNRVVVGIGSNTADRDKRMAAAVDYFSASFSDVVVSSIYETLEWSGRYAPYLNCVAEGLTDRPIEEITDELKQYEIDNGRTPEMKLTGAVTIDMDIVLWNDEVIRPVDMEREYFRRGYDQLNGSSR
ncbi:2-amino-4-hydroxy-6-hydroxymethyldihydropteridine diphosphokinase [Heminiphilus faecis]|uniref:2-amino-4-hydroxy-6-hydroxymethyldihydropteridine pyrophosphokinase n=1 Tax=Heminiphilus faecis TaxID=2601703 RepID=A0ABV4CTW0_9BACT